MRKPITILALALVSTLLFACNSDDAKQSSEGEGINLTLDMNVIDVSNGQTVDNKEVDVSCPDDGEEVCRAVEQMVRGQVGMQSVSPPDFELKEQTPCTRIYWSLSGSKTTNYSLLVRGEINGERVDAVFPAYGDGCDQQRWELVDDLVKQTGLLSQG